MENELQMRARWVSVVVQHCGSRRNAPSQLLSRRRGGDEQACVQVCHAKHGPFCAIKYYTLINFARNSVKFGEKKTDVVPTFFETLPCFPHGKMQCSTVNPLAATSSIRASLSTVAHAMSKLVTLLPFFTRRTTVIAKPLFCRRCDIQQRSSFSIASTVHSSPSEVASTITASGSVVRDYKRYGGVMYVYENDGVDARVKDSLNIFIIFNMEYIMI